MAAPDTERFVSGHVVPLLDECRDAVVKGVGRVVVGERPLTGGFGKEPREVRPSASRGSEACGQLRQTRVGRCGRCGGGDPGEPFTNAGLARLEGMIKAALGNPLGRGRSRAPGGTQVGVGNLMSCTPLLDPGQQVGGDAQKVLGPPRRCRIIGGEGANLLAELAGEAVAGGQIGLPGGVVEELRRNAGQPGSRRGCGCSLGSGRADSRRQRPGHARPAAHRARRPQPERAQGCGRWLRSA